ncbi:MAG: 2-oxoglutarate dehydrogenase E1 component, partial [Flavobacteriales bacterium]
VSAKKADVLVFCSGKVYYEILEQKEKLGVGGNMAVIRVEQLYPLPEARIREIISQAPKGTSLVWAQEEPENMGAWSYIMRAMRDLPWEVASLQASASPATGSPKVHERRMRAMFDRLFSFASVKA